MNAEASLIQKLLYSFNCDNPPRHVLSTTTTVRALLVLISALVWILGYGRLGDGVSKDERGCCGIELLGNRRAVVETSVEGCRHRIA